VSFLCGRAKAFVVAAAFSAGQLRLLCPQYYTCFLFHQLYFSYCTVPFSPGKLLYLHIRQRRLYYFNFFSVFHMFLWHTCRSFLRSYLWAFSFFRNDHKEFL
jgi:hypothetical protein